MNYVYSLYVYSHAMYPTAQSAKCILKHLRPLKALSKVERTGAAAECLDCRGSG